MNGVPISTHDMPQPMSSSTVRWQVKWSMSKVNFFAIPADLPDRAISFYQTVFGWKFELGWEYDTPQGRDKYWHVITSDGVSGGLTRREYPGQPISLGIEVPTVDMCTDLVEKSGGKTVVPKVAIPGVAWFAVCQDSEGNTFSIYQPDPAAGAPA